MELPERFPPTRGLSPFATRTLRGTCCRSATATACSTRTSKTSSTGDPSSVRHLIDCLGCLQQTDRAVVLIRLNRRVRDEACAGAAEPARAAGQRGEGAGPSLQAFSAHSAGTLNTVTKGAPVVELLPSGVTLNSRKSAFARRVSACAMSSVI